MLRTICSFLNGSRAIHDLLYQLLRLQKIQKSLTVKYLVFVFKNIVSKPQILKLFDSPTDIDQFESFYVKSHSTLQTCVP